MDIIKSKKCTTIMEGAGEQATEMAIDVANAATDAIDAAPDAIDAAANAAVEGARQAGNAVVSGGQHVVAGINAAANSEEVRQAGAAVRNGANVAGNAAVAGGRTAVAGVQRAGQAMNAAVNSDEARQAGTAARQGINVAGNAAISGGQQVVAGVNAAANSEQAAAVANAARVAGGAVVAGFQSIPVPQMNFDAETAKKTMGAASVAVGACFVDVMQLEIVRDFFQFLGTMVDNITMPDSFKYLFGNLASLASVSFGRLLAFIEAITPTAWFFIFLIAALIPWGMLIFFMRRDLNLDIRFAATREAKAKLSWKRRNEKGKMTFYTIKATILACTTLYAPVTRNCLQLIAGHKKYYPTYACSIGNCDDPNYGGMAFLAVVIFLIFSVAMPWKLYKVIESLKPKFIDASDPEHPYANEPPIDALVQEKEMYAKLHGKNIWYNNEGEPEEFTDELYAVAVKQAGENPYVSLYSGYEQKWAGYKLWVMGFKVLQMLPVIFIGADIGQSVGATVVMALFAGFSFYASPFISASHDKLDLCSRITLVLTPLLLIFSSLVHNDALWGALLNIVNAVNFGFMVYFTVKKLPIVKKKLKAFHGTLEYGDPAGGVLPYEGEGIPHYDLNLERRRRLWKPFWDNLFATDPALKAYDDVEGKAGAKKRRDSIIGPNGVQIPFPQTRLEEMLDTLHHRGRIAFEKSLMPLSQDELNFRNYLQDVLEGVDCYCTDQWQTVPGVSICKDGEMNSATKFGRLEIEPYPFSVKFYWDGAGKDWGEIFPWTDKYGRIRELYQMNMAPKVQDMKQVRLMLRGMAKSPQLFYLVQHRTERKQVPDGKDSDGKTKYKTITIQWTYENGKVAVRGDFGDSPFEQGFNVSMKYNDGVGRGSDGSHHTGSFTFGGDAMGVTNTFDRTPRFNELCNNRNNKQSMEQGIQMHLQEQAQFKVKLKSERVMTQWTLGWGFWYWVYNNDVISRQNLHAYLQKSEQNPAVKSIPTKHKQGLDCLFNLVGFYNSSPLFAMWYTYWDDVWQHNQDIAGIKANEAVFSKNSPTSICFKPMQKDELKTFLKELGDPLGKKQDEHVDNLYARIEELEQAATEHSRRQIATFAQPVVNTNCKQVILSYPKDPKLIAKFLSGNAKFKSPSGPKNSWAGDNKA